MPAESGKPPKRRGRKLSAVPKTRNGETMFTVRFKNTTHPELHKRFGTLCHAADTSMNLKAIELIDAWVKAEEAKASDWLDSVISPKQKELRAKHGTPAEFAEAVYKAVPGDISMEEADTAVQEYNQEWDAAT